MFKGCHFPPVVILTCLRWYLRYKLSYRDLEELMAERGVGIDHSTLNRWVLYDRRRRGDWCAAPEFATKPTQPPRRRRECLGELVQIDGCDHEWFEDRGPRRTVLVYATSRLLELRFVRSESTFDYFAATDSYLRKPGKPGSVGAKAEWLGYPTIPGVL